MPPASEFTITFAGALYGTRTLRPFLRVLEDLVRAEKIPLDRLRVRVIGPSWEQIRSDLAGSALERRVDAPGQLSHAETLRHMRATTLNLLVDIIYQGPNIHVPGKLYEYLKAGRPVLALSVPGQTESLIREAEAGWVVPPGDEAALRAVLVSAFEDWQAGRALPRPRQEVAQRDDRARQAGRRVEVLQECIERVRKGKGSA